MTTISREKGDGSLEFAGWRDFAARVASRIHDNFSSGTAEEHFQTIQDVSAEDTLVAGKVGVQAAFVFLTVKVDPEVKHESTLVSAPESG